MSLKSIRNTAKRNGFDLSTKRNFTAKVGELLPVYVREVIPGDKFMIDVKSLMRTMPLNTAAFARLRYYFDFYFVPYEILWRFSDTVLSQMNDNAHHSISSDPSANNSLVPKVPYVSASTIATYLNQVGTAYEGNDYIGRNFLGFSRSLTSAKLLEYLGYGNYYDYAQVKAGTAPIPPTSQWSKNPFPTNVNCNLFPLLAYQKIYSDYYRDSQWERFNPTIFNVDWMTGQSDPVFNTDNLTQNFKNYSNMFDLRYANWQKDMFHGVLPNQQYGDQSVARSYINSISAGKDAGSEFNATLHFIDNTPSSAYNNVKYLHMEHSQLSPNPDYNYSTLSIIALRQAEALQKYKEVALATSKSYKDQIEAHWNVKVTGDYGDMSQYLGGFDSTLDINEVVNTNITSDYEASIAGKGIGVSNGKITYDSTGQYGLIMCIFHCKPLIDYTTNGCDKFITRVNATDFAIPEMDSIGMELLPSEHLTNKQVKIDPSLSALNQPFNLGYVPRYIDYKTDYDRSYGGFKDSLKNWIISYNDTSVLNARSSLYKVFGTLPSGTDSTLGVDFTFFKVSPSSVNSLFGVNAGNDNSTDQLLISSFFDIKAIRNLDVNGLPY